MVSPKLHSREEIRAAYQQGEKAVIALVERLLARGAELEVQVQMLTARVAELEEQLEKEIHESRNSSSGNRLANLHKRCRLQLVQQLERKADNLVGLDSRVDSK